MNLELLLFTRTRQADYHFYLPLSSEASEQVTDFVQDKISELQQKSVSRDVYFFTSGTDAVLLRIIDTGNTDLYARPIRSLEGFYCPAQDVYAFWLELWHTVSAFYCAPSFVPRLLNGERLIPCTAQAVFDSLYDAKQHPSLYDKLYTAKYPVSFAAQKEQIRFSSPIEKAVPERWHSKQTRSCTLRLKLERKERFARLCAYTTDEPRMLICASDRIPFDKQGISVQELHRHAKGLEKYLEAHGWYILGGDNT